MKPAEVSTVSGSNCIWKATLFLPTAWLTSFKLVLLSLGEAFDIVYIDFQFVQFGSKGGKVSAFRMV